MKISLITFGATRGSAGGIEQYSANLIDAFLCKKEIKLVYVFSKAPLKLNVLLIIRLTKCLGVLRNMALARIERHF